MINLKINGLDVTVEKGCTILEAAAAAGINIPSLCHLKGVCSDGLCRLCIVKVNGREGFCTACNTPAAEGMEIITEDDEILDLRRMTLDLICSRHRMECEYCSRYMDCRLHELLVECGMDDRKYSSAYVEAEEDASSPIFVRDKAKCVGCRRCEAICAVQGIHAIGALGRGKATSIGAAVPMPETGCVGCGQCVAVCPTGALSIKSDVQKVWNLMRVGKKQLIAAVTPELFEKLGSFMHCADPNGERLSAFLRAMGFKRVYAIPESDENPSGGLQFSKRCPAAVKFISERYPELSVALCTDDAPMNTAAKLCRKDYSQSAGTPSEDTAAILITSCAAEKDNRNGFDAVLTARELVSFMNQGAVSKFTMLKLWSELTPLPLDSLAADDTGRGDKETLEVHGLAALAELIESGKLAGKDLLVKAYACPDGCRGGGGQLS